MVSLIDTVTSPLVPGFLKQLLFGISNNAEVGPEIEHGRLRDTMRAQPAACCLLLPSVNPCCPPVA